MVGRELTQKKHWQDGVMPGSCNKNSSTTAPFSINSTPLFMSFSALLNGVFRFPLFYIDQKVNEIVASHRQNPSSSKTLAVA